MKRSLIKFMATAAVALVAVTTQAADTVKAGVLHSLSGTMAMNLMRERFMI